MSLLNSYICPNCNNPFPLFTKSSVTIRTSFFLTPDLKCQKCGQLCHVKIDHKSALIAWPAAAAYIGFILFILHNAPISRYLHGEGWWLYIILGAVLVFAPFFVVIRRGFKLVKVEGDQKNEKTKYRKWLVIFYILMSCALLGYYTKDWSYVIFCIVAFFVIRSVFYSLWQKNK